MMLKHLFMCLLAICMSSWEKKSIQVFGPYLNHVVFCLFVYWRIMLYNIVVASAIHQCKSVMIILYICSLLSLPPLRIPALSIITEHQAGLSVLHSSFPLAVRFRHNGVYLSMLPSQFVPPSPSPTVPTRPFSVSASPFLLCK